mgnify:CR=1 FL=1
MINVSKEGEIMAQKLYKKGDLLVYRREVCRVIRIAKSDFTKDKCYVLVPFANPDGSVKMQVPISDKGGHLRDMITKEEIQDLIEAIKNQEPVESKTSNLKSQYSNLLNSDSLEDLVRIIKTSYQRNQQRIAQNKRTASIDDEYLHKAEKYLFNEIAASLNISYEEAEQYFKEQVNR